MCEKDAVIEKICDALHGILKKTGDPESPPASCKTFLHDHAFDPQITGYSGRIGVRIEFTAGEVKPPVKPVVNRGKAVLGMLRHIFHRESSAVHSHR